MPNAILSSFKIAPNAIEPDHFDNEFISFFVDKEEYKTLTIIIKAPVNANGNHASGFNCPCGNAGVEAKNTPYPRKALLNPATHANISLHDIKRVLSL